MGWKYARKALKDWLSICYCYSHAAKVSKICLREKCFGIDAR